MARPLGSQNKAGKHEPYPTIGSSAPPMQFPQRQIRENKLRVGRLYANPEVAEVDTTIWRSENVLGKNLATARELAGFTQDALARAIGVSERTIRRYESGEAVPDASLLRMLSVITGCSCDWLLGLIDDDQRNLLDYYDYATRTQRESIMTLAKMVQAGKEDKAAAMAEKDKAEFLAHADERIAKAKETIELSKLRLDNQ